MQEGGGPAAGRGAAQGRELAAERLGSGDRDRGRAAGAAPVARGERGGEQMEGSGLGVHGARVFPSCCEQPPGGPIPSQLHQNGLAGSVLPSSLALIHGEGDNEQL